MGTAFLNAEAQDEYVPALKKLHGATCGALQKGGPAARAACKLQTAI